MGRIKNRKIKIRITGRDPKDPLSYFKAIEKAFQPKDIEIEIKDKSEPTNKEDPDSYTIPNEQLEQKVIEKTKKSLDAKAKKKKKSKSSSKVETTRKRITSSLKKLIKEGYRITIKSFFDSVMEKMKNS